MSYASRYRAVSNDHLYASCCSYNAGGSIHAHLSSSFFPAVFFLFGARILHSMEKATQFVHGTPKLAASQRICYVLGRISDPIGQMYITKEEEDDLVYLSRMARLAGSTRSLSPEQSTPRYLGRRRRVVLGRMYR